MDSGGRTRRAVLLASGSVGVTALTGAGSAVGEQGTRRSVGPEAARGVTTSTDRQGPPVVQWRVDTGTGGSARQEPFATPFTLSRPGGFALASGPNGFYAADEGLVLAVGTDGSERWRASYDGELGQLQLVAGTDLLVATVRRERDWWLYVWTISEGEQQSEVALPGRPRGLRFDAPSLLFVGSDDGVHARYLTPTVYAWDRDLGSPGRVTGVLEKSGYLVAYTDSAVHALRSETGETVWRTGIDEASVAVGVEDVYVGTGTGVRALAGADGTERWERTLAPDASLVGVGTAGREADGSAVPRLFAFPDGAKVVRLDAETGRSIWQSRGFSDILLDFLVDVESGVSYAVLGQEVIAFDESGTRRWRFRGRGVYSRLVPTENVAYLLSGGRVVALDPASGRVIWSLDTGDHHEYQDYGLGWLPGGKGGTAGTLCVERTGTLFGLDVARVPSFTADIRGVAPNASMFVGPPGGDRYQWTIGEETFEGRRVQRTFIRPGEYEVELVVDWPTEVRTTSSRTVTVPEPTSTPSPTPTPTSTATTSPSPTEGSPESASTDASGSGFGVVGALAALGSLAALRNQREDDTES